MSCDVSETTVIKNSLGLIFISSIVNIDFVLFRSCIMKNKKMISKTAQASLLIRSLQERIFYIQSILCTYKKKVYFIPKVNGIKMLVVKVLQ